MNRFKYVMLSLVATMALSGVIAGVAQAHPPFWTVKGAKLAKNTEKVAATFTIKESKLSAGSDVITCTKGKSENGNLVGGVPGTAEGKLVYEECSVTGNGTSCSVTGKKITTEALKATLVTAATTLAKGENIDALFQPASGSVFAKVLFTGTCTLPETAVEGKTAVEALDNTKANVTLEGNEPEPEFGFAKSPSTAISSVSEDTESTMTEVKPSLKAFGKSATLVGEAELKLTSGGKFGVKTK